MPTRLPEDSVSTTLQPNTNGGALNVPELGKRSLVGSPNVVQAMDNFTIDSRGVCGVAVRALPVHQHARSDSAAIDTDVHADVRRSPALLSVAGSEC